MIVDGREKDRRSVVTQSRGGGLQEGLSLASDPLVQNVRLAIDYVSLVRSIKVTSQDEYGLVMYRRSKQG